MDILVRSNADARLVGPCLGDVAGGVAASTEDQQRDTQSLDEVDARPMGFDIQVETAEPITPKGVGAALDDDGGGAVDVIARPNDILEKLTVLLVVDAIIEGYVQGMMRARAAVVQRARIHERAGAGEEVGGGVFVEGHGHDAIG